LSGPIYVASKHAISGFTRSLTLLDEKYGVKVVTLAPGYVTSKKGKGKTVPD
jgi:NAD(P)-dependent dehydrogenase (short-subunit alcohol dehydrogenase family)